VIAVVILPTRIRIEPLILVRVFASLTDSILIAGSIADIAVVPIVRLVVDGRDSGSGSRLESHSRIHCDRHSGTPALVPSIAHSHEWPVASPDFDNR
jgi:hypothetical protein